MYPLKQSTAITIPVFVHDENGDAVTSLVDGGFTKRMSKNGGAFAAMTVTITEMENGWYSLPLTTAHTDTLGVLSISLLHASAKQVNLQFRVEAKLVADLNDVSLAAIQSEINDVQSDIAALNNLSAAEVNAEVVDALNVDTYAEPAAVPAATATLVEKLGWLMALARNKITQTENTQTLRDDGDSATIATSSLSDDGSTLTRNKWTT